MCRNIKILYNTEPPAKKADIEACALQYVRKVTGINKPSAASQAAYDQAVEEVTNITMALIRELVTSAAPRSSNEVVR